MNTTYDNSSVCQRLVAVATFLALTCWASLPAQAQLPSVTTGNVTFHLNGNTLGPGGFGLTDGASVSTWQTDEGPLNSALASGSLQPTFVLDAAGGHSAVRFDDIDDVMELANEVDAESIFIYSRLDVDFDATPKQQSMWLGDGDASVKVFGVRRTQPAQTGAPVVFVKDEPAQGSSTGFSDTSSFHLHGWTSGSGLFIDGEDTGSAPLTYSYSGDDQIDLIGDERGGIPDNPGPGATFAEILLYDAPLDETDRQAVEAYFVGKYGGISPDAVWNDDGIGRWSDSTKWAGPAPVGNESTATFGDAISAARTVVVDTSITTNAITFDHSLGSGQTTYVVAGAATVNLEQTPDNTLPTLNILQGEHQMQAALEIKNDTTMTVSDGTIFDFNNKLALGANDLTIARALDGVALDGVVNVHHSVTGTGTLTNSATMGTGSATSVAGDLENDGILNFDIRPNSTGSLAVAGDVTLDGTVNVNLLDGAAPAGDITLLVAGSPITLPNGLPALNVTGGTGYSLELDPSGTSLLLTTGLVGLTGDYNGSGTVDAADFTVWRDNLGTNNALPNDPIGGTIDVAQYLQWVSSFGGSSASGSSAAVPEPASLLLIAAGLTLGFGSRLRRSVR